MNAPQRPILYSFRRCPYAMRARLSLYAKNISCELREVHLKNKPEEMLDISPKGTVPVLQLPDSTVIDESLDVMLWATSQNSINPKMPSIISPTDEMLNLISEIDGPFKHHLDRYKYENRFDGVVSKEHRDQNIDMLHNLDSRLTQHKYLFGEQITFADIAIAPFLRQFANTDKEWFSNTEFGYLKKWLEAFCTSEYFNDVMPKLKIWENVDTLKIFPFNSST